MKISKKWMSSFLLKLDSKFNSNFSPFWWLNNNPMVSHQYEYRGRFHVTMFILPNELLNTNSIISFHSSLLLFYNIGYVLDSQLLNWKKVNLRVAQSDESEQVWAEQNSSKRWINVPETEKTEEWISIKKRKGNKNFKKKKKSQK